MSEGAIMYPMPSGDPSVATTVLSSVWTMAAVTTIFLGLRIYCRALRTTKMWWDDYLLVSGWVFLLLATSLQTVIFRKGYLVTTLTGPVIMPVNLASDTAMKLSLALSKTSFALTLLRFATGWTRYVVISAAFVMDAMCIAHSVLVWRANCGAPDPHTFGPCWSADSGLWMNMVGSSKDNKTHHQLTSERLTFDPSHICSDRLHSRNDSYQGCLGIADDQTRKGRRSHCDGHRLLVSQVGKK